MQAFFGKEASGLFRTKMLRNVLQNKCQHIIIVLEFSLPSSCDSGRQDKTAEQIPR